MHSPFFCWGKFQSSCPSQRCGSSVNFASEFTEILLLKQHDFGHRLQHPPPQNKKKQEDHVCPMFSDFPLARSWHERSAAAAIRSPGAMLTVKKPPKSSGKRRFYIFFTMRIPSKKLRKRFCLMSFRSFYHEDSKICWILNRVGWMFFGLSSHQNHMAVGQNSSQSQTPCNKNTKTKSSLFTTQVNIQCYSPWKTSTIVV